MSTPLMRTMEGYNVEMKTATFDGGTANAVGDDGGTLDPYTLFTVTGQVAMRLLAVCTTDLASAGGGTVEVGTAITTAGLIAQTTATTIDINEIWQDSTPDASVEAITTIPERIVTQNVILTVATADVTAGVIRFIALWRPLSPDANVVANTAN